MIICKICGVELDPDVQNCPLCNEPIGKITDDQVQPDSSQTLADEFRGMDQPQRKITWEIVSIIIFLIITVTSLLNFLINKQFSWAEYPIASCLVIFSYVSVFAFLNRKRIAQILYGFIMSSCLILILDIIAGGLSWSIRLGIPLLFFISIVLMGFILVLKQVRQRGVNIIAYAFIAAALLGISTEAVMDLYFQGTIRLVWSLIVVGCVLPIVTVLLYMHFRLKKGKDLNRTFHI